MFGIEPGSTDINYKGDQLLESTLFNHNNLMVLRQGALNAHAVIVGQENYEKQ